MNMKSFQKMMKQAQKMQSKIEKEMGELEVEASSGGGMVVVRMDGGKHLLAVEIDREVVDPQETDMLQDLILAAVNEATRKVDQALESRVGGMSELLGGMGQV